MTPTDSPALRDAPHANLRAHVMESVRKSGSGAVLVSAAAVADLFADYDAQIEALTTQTAERADAEWISATLPPARTTADATGATVGLALYLPMPADGGPSMRQGWFCHGSCNYIDSMTGYTVEPMLWSMPSAALRATQQPNDGGEGGGG